MSSLAIQNGGHQKETKIKITKPKTNMSGHGHHQRHINTKPNKEDYGKLLKLLYATQVNDNT